MYLSLVTQLLFSVFDDKINMTRVSEKVLEWNLVGAPAGKVYDTHEEKEIDEKGEEKARQQPLCKKLRWKWNPRSCLTFLFTPFQHVLSERLRLSA